MKKIFILSLILTLFFTSHSFSEGDKAVYSLFLKNEKSVVTFTELTTYINKKLNLNLKTEIILDYHRAGLLIFRKDALLGFLCSGPYTALRDKYNFEVLAAIKPTNNREYKSYIIVHKDSGIKSLKDLKNKSFAYVDLLSYTGRVTTINEILKLNEDPLKFFSEIIYSKSHINSIELVANKKVDGAGVMSLVFENLAKIKPEITSKISIIFKTPKAGYPVFVTSQYNDKKLIEELKNILLNMHKDPEGKKILSSLEIEHLFYPDLKDYKIIEEHIKTTEKYIPY